MPVTLMSLDNKTFTVDQEVAERSVLIKNRGEFDSLIHLEEVPGSVLLKVIEYCEHHRNDPVQVQDEITDPRRRLTKTEEWDTTFMQVNLGLLFGILHAANYLNIRPLLDIGCKTVANLIKGKTPKEIRNLFHIESNFTSDEEAQIRKEDEWGRGSLNDKE